MYPTIILIFILVYIVSRSFYAVDIFTYHHMAMDTMLELRFECTSQRRAEEVKKRVFAEVDRLESKLSRTEPGSSVSEINSNAGITPVSVDEEVFAVIEDALYYAEITGGAFDPTVAPLVDQWGFIDQNYRVPEAEELEAALELVDYSLVEINYDQLTVFLPVEGMALELGGIAKGYIVDRVLEMLREEGLENAYVNAGDIGLLGNRPDGDPWRIGIRNPRDNQDVIAIIPLTDKSVDTSGDYERVFEEKGVRYHHLLDPFSGMPADNLASVTVIADTTMDADVLSTAAFILGLEKGMALIEDREDLEAVFITPELEIHISSGLKDIIELML